MVTQAPPITSIIHRFLPAMRLLRHHERRGESPTLGDLTGSLGSHAPAISAALLALPFAVPVSLGPLTTPVSLTILFLGWAMWRRSETLGLPQRLASARVPVVVARLFRKCVAVLARWRHRRLVGRHRLRLVPEANIHHVGGMGIILGALLLAIPVPLLPLTNTFPALSVIFFARYHVERNEVMLLLGVISLVISVAIFALLAWLVFVIGMDLHSMLSWGEAAAGEVAGGNAGDADL